MVDEREDAGERREGTRQGLGFLTAFKDALEETLADARERGDLSADRAREMVRGALSRARDAAEEARERLDFATRQEVDDLRDLVGELKTRLENLERRASQDPSAGPSRPEGSGPSAGAHPSREGGAGGVAAPPGGEAPPA